MKVYHLAPSAIGPLPRVQQPASDTAVRPAARKAAPDTDRVALSDLAGQMRAAALHDQARHVQRLAQMRELIANDRYHVDAKDVAEAILRDEIEPWKAK